MNIVAKLGNMRKESDFTIYPPRKDGSIVIQSEHRIAVFRADGHGLLSKHVASGAYFIHLSPMAGATAVIVPPDVVTAALNLHPTRGTEIGPGVYVG